MFQFLKKINFSCSARVQAKFLKSLVSLWNILQTASLQIFLRFYFLNGQPHLLQHLLMLLNADACINPCGVDAAVSKDIGQVDDIVMLPIISAGKQMAQIVGKDLPFVHPRFPAQLFHI